MSHGSQPTDQTNQEPFAVGDWVWIDIEAYRQWYRENVSNSAFVFEKKPAQVIWLLPNAIYVKQSIENRKEKSCRTAGIPSQFLTKIP